MVGKVIDFDMNITVCIIGPDHHRSVGSVNHLQPAVCYETASGCENKTTGLILTYNYTSFGGLNC